jgi:glycosyltransferase involved in cell wall biosynthesis
MSKPIRMLVISSDTFPPTRVDVSVLFGKELAGRGHRIDWLLQSAQACDTGYATPWNGGSIWVGRTDLGDSLYRRIRKHLLGITHDLKLFGIVRCGDYDLVEVKDKFVSGLFALLATRLYRKRFIYWLSFPYAEEYLIRAADGTARYPFLYRIRGNAFRLLLYRILLPAADHVFVQSEQMRRDVAREGIALERLTAVPMGIDPERFPAAALAGVRSAIPEGQRCFLYLGSLSKVRRLDFLIRVLAQLRRGFPDMMLYLVGRGDDPSDERLLEDEARRLGVSSAVVFVGQLAQAQALEYVRDADVCVSPIYPTPILNAASPTKLVEYMAMGKAVVANDHPEQRLLIEQSGAGLCVAWDEVAFAAAIGTLLSDQPLADAMGQRGRQYALDHRAYPIIADLVEAKLMQVAAREPGQSR